MFKKLLSLLLCLASCSVYGDILLKPDGSKIEEQYNIDFNLIQGPEFEKLIDLLSIESKVELDVFISRGKNVLNNCLIALIDKHKNLYNKFAKMNGNKIIVTVILSVNDENIDLSKINSLNMESFIKNLSAEELEQLDVANSEYAQLIDSQDELFFNELEQSTVNKELKEKSNNKNFKVQVIFS